MACEFKMQRRVEFAETDMAGILHFSNYFRYMEEVEHAFFRSLGMSVHPHGNAGAFGWARARAECDFRQPLRYEDVVELHLLVREKRERAITYRILFRLRDADAEDEAVVAVGSVVAVCVSKPAGDGRLQTVPMPPEVDSVVEVAPPELLSDAD